MFSYNVILLNYYVHWLFLFACPNMAVRSVFTSVRRNFMFVLTQHLLLDFYISLSCVSKVVWYFTFLASKCGNRRGDFYQDRRSTVWRFEVNGLYFASKEPVSPVVLINISWSYFIYLFSYTFFSSVFTTLGKIKK